MGIGSKGLDAPVIIGIILAVIAAVVILYILWTRGLAPFVPLADKTVCLTEILDACSGVREWGGVNKNCLIFSDIKNNCGSCIKPASSGSCQPENCCKWAMIEREKP